MAEIWYNKGSYLKVKRFLIKEINQVQIAGSLTVVGEMLIILNKLNVINKLYQEPYSNSVHVYMYKYENLQDIKNNFTPELCSKLIKIYRDGNMV